MDSVGLTRLCLQTRQDEIQAAYAGMESHYELMQEEGIPVKPDQLAQYNYCTIEFSNMRVNLDTAESRKVPQPQACSMLF
jgi:hypothetical protein